MAKSLADSSRAGARILVPLGDRRRGDQDRHRAPPPTRYSVGFGARPLIFLSRHLPDRSVDALIKRASGVPA
ncbi:MULTISPECIES: hypothetical protein [unclassified Streptomyces]|uniref:Uncharacterized protein n=1 Tax=Streptomyces sp. R08 TaxID=3238624 RepID=A0AB39MPB4_9ACTN